MIAFFVYSFTNGQLKLHRKCSTVNISFKVKNSTQDTMSLFIAGSCKGNGKLLFVPEKGIFKYSGLINRATEGMIFTTTKGNVDVDGPTVIHFIVEPGNMTVSFSMENNAPKNIQITGSKSEVEKESWNNKYAPVFAIEKKCRQELAILNRNHRADTTEQTKKWRDRVVTEFDAIREIKGLLAIGYINKHPDSYFSVYLLFKYFHIINADSAAQSFVHLTPNVAQSELGIQAADRILGNSNHWEMIKKYADSSFIKKWMNSKSVYDLSGRDTSGKPIDFSTFKGKYLFIDFWATWCGPCINIGLPRLREAAANTKDLPVEYVAINVNDPNEAGKWKQFVKKLDYPGINVFDGDKFLRSYFKVYLYPTYFLIDAEGNIMNNNGFMTDKPLSALIRELISGGN